MLGEDPAKKKDGFDCIDGENRNYCLPVQAVKCNLGDCMSVRFLVLLHLCRIVTE